MFRKRLPNRRNCQSFSFWHGSLEYQASIGYYDRYQTEIGEIFLSCGKTGSDANLNMREASIAASLFLQYGGSISELRSAMPRRVSGDPEGPLGTLLDLLLSTEKKDAEEELLT
jgi:hypothetical protein